MVSRNKSDFKRDVLGCFMEFCEICEIRGIDWLDVARKYLLPFYILGIDILNKAELKILLYLINNGESYFSNVSISCNIRPSALTKILYRMRANRLIIITGSKAEPLIDAKYSILNFEVESMDLSEIREQVKSAKSDNELAYMRQVVLAGLEIVDTAIAERRSKVKATRRRGRKGSHMEGGSNGKGEGGHAIGVGEGTPEIKEKRTLETPPTPEIKEPESRIEPPAPKKRRGRPPKNRLL